MGFASDGDDDEEGWGEQQQPMSPGDMLPSQHKDALMGALRNLAKSTAKENVDADADEDMPLRGMPLLVIKTPEDLARLQYQEEMAKQYRALRERQCTVDFLTSMLFPIPEGMFYRYSQLNHIFKLILFTNNQIPCGAVDDGARLSEADIVLLATICLPDWWVEIGERGPFWWRNLRQDGAVSLAEALPQAWDAYRTSGPELEQVTLPFPCPFKKMSEDGLILWAICFVTSVKNWYFGRDPGGKPNILDPVVQELLFFRGNIPGCPDPIAAMMDDAVCNGKAGQKGFLLPVECVYQSYHMLIDVSPREDQALVPLL